MFNLRNKFCQEKFKKETQDNTQLIKCFENELPLEIQSKKWLELFNTILQNCFRKIRVDRNSRKEDMKDELIKERVELKNKSKLVSNNEDMKIKIEKRIKEIEEKIGDEVAASFHKEIVETINNLGGDHQNLNGSGRKELWKLLKRKVPKNAAVVPVGKKDKSGKLITNYEGLNAFI